VDIHQGTSSVCFTRGYTCWRGKNTLSHTATASHGSVIAVVPVSCRHGARHVASMARDGSDRPCDRNAYPPTVPSQETMLYSTEVNMMGRSSWEEVGLAHGIGNPNCS